MLNTAAGDLVSCIKSPFVDETGLPQTTRHLFQFSYLNVMKFDTSLSDSVSREGGIHGDEFHPLNT